MEEEVDEEAVELFSGGGVLSLEVMSCREIIS